MFSILLHIQLSQTSNLFLKVSDSVDVSAAYSMTLQMVIFTIIINRSRIVYLVELTAAQVIK